jgi:hypothetical protein
MTGNLLAHAADYFKSREVMVRFKDDDRGRYAFTCMMPGVDGYKTPMVVTAKKYLVNRDGVQVASFMERKVCQRASDMDGKVVLFVGGSDRWLVFDPDAILEHGLEPDSRSTRRKSEDWLDVPAAWGCRLESYADRAASPQTEPNGRWPPTQSGKPTAADGGSAPAGGQQGLDRWS